VTLLANSQLRYDPAGAFADLAGAETGTTFAEAEDQFSYTLSGGSAATVTVTITGENTGGEVIRGDGLANSLRGALDFQSLNAKAGNDVLDDAGFTVRLNGGLGDDTYLVASSTASIKELADAGRDHVITTLASYTLTSHLEDLTFAGAATTRFNGYGNDLGNRITGGDAADFLFGYAGDDELVGLAGSDYLDGGEGSDLLDGGSGGDLLLGHAGNDLLLGGLGNDQLTGGSGADTFRFDTALGPNNIDSITDFASGSDVIELDRSVFAAIDPGALAGTTFETGTAATSADTRIVYDPATGSIYYDADGSGAGDMVLFAVLGPGTALSASDFFGV
jgi:Ca2+-binding RTX toxin-like protein